MKRIEIINMFRTLGKIKLNKVADKSLRDALISNNPKIFRIAKENDEYIASLREQFDPEAVKDVNEAYQRYAEEEVKIDLVKIDREAFGDMIAGSDIDLTLGEMTLLEPLFEEG